MTPAAILDVCGRATAGRAAAVHTVARHSTQARTLTCAAESVSASETLPKRRTETPQPVAGGLVLWTRLGDKTPVCPGVIHPPQVHQLMNQYVIAHEGWHQEQPPVQADVTVAAAGTPPRVLITHADSRHRESMQGGKLQQACWQLAPCLFSKGAVVAGRVGCACFARSLFENPVDVSLNERLCVTA